MPSRQTIGVAQLLTGMLLASRPTQAINQSGLSLWSVPGFVGGCAAIFVGLGTVLGWDTFNQEPSGSNSTSVAILGVATVSVIAGATVAVV